MVTLNCCMLYRTLGYLIILSLIKHFYRHEHVNVIQLFSTDGRSLSGCCIQIITKFYQAKPLGLSAFIAEQGISFYPDRVSEVIAAGYLKITNYG